MIQIKNITQKITMLRKQHSDCNTSLSLQDFVIERYHNDCDFMNWLFSEPDIKDFNHQYAQAFYDFLDSL